MENLLQPPVGHDREDEIIDLENGPGSAADEPAAIAGESRTASRDAGEARLDPSLDEVIDGRLEVSRARTAPAVHESGREAVLSRDPVRAYLREMGAIEALSREEEVALAMRIEAAQNSLVAALCRIPSSVELFAGWIDGVREGRLRAGDVFELPSVAADESADSGETSEFGIEPADSGPLTLAAGPLGDLAAPLGRLAAMAGEIAVLSGERLAPRCDDDRDVAARLDHSAASFAEAAAVLPLRADKVSVLTEMVHEESKRLGAAEIRLAKLAAACGIERRRALDMLAGMQSPVESTRPAIEEELVALREEFAAIERRMGLPHADFRRAAAAAGKAWRELRAERERMVRAQLPLVMSIARRYQRRSSLELLDLVQEGNLGLMHAVEKFDYRRGVKVSTYAVWWIRQSIARAIADKGRMIRVPVHMAETTGKVLRERRVLQQREGRQAEAEEIARRTGIPLPHVERALTLVQDPTSLDLPVGEDGDATLGDLIEAPDAVNPQEAAEASALRDTIASALGELTPREQRILQMRFGIGDSTEHTLEEFGREFGVTRERIRQIEAKALGKLRHARRSRALSSFIEP